jgi:hypothetical protein
MCNSDTGKYPKSYQYQLPECLWNSLQLHASVSFILSCGRQTILQISTHAVTTDKSVSLLGGLTAIVKLHASFRGCSTHTAVYEPVNLTFRGPCIVIHSYDKSQKYALFLNFILVKNSIRFGQTYCPSSGVLILYPQQLVFVMLTVC